MEFREAARKVGSFIHRVNTPKTTQGLGEALLVLAKNRIPFVDEKICLAFFFGASRYLTTEEGDKFARELVAQDHNGSHEVLEHALRYNLADKLSDETLEEIAYALEAAGTREATGVLQALSDKGLLLRLSDGMRDSVEANLERSSVTAVPVR